MQNVQLDVLKHPAKFHFILWYSPGDTHRLLDPLDGVLEACGRPVGSIFALELWTYLLDYR